MGEATSQPAMAGMNRQQRRANTAALRRKDYDARAMAEATGLPVEAVERMPAGLRSDIAGVPDIVVVWRGHGHFIEVKAEDGTVSLPQQSVATAILVAGAEWGAARDAIEALALLNAWSIPRNRNIRGPA